MKIHARMTWQGFWLNELTQSLASEPIYPPGMAAYADGVDYVGPNGHKLRRLIPREFYGVDINRSAYFHDWFYALGVNSHAEKTPGGLRYDADKAFLHHMHQQIREQQQSRVRWATMTWSSR
jgi:hypothetical protein